MNVAEEVGGAIGDHLSKHLLHEDETSTLASHVVETVWSQTAGASVAARVYRFAEDGDTRIPLGWVRATVTYEPDEPGVTTGDPS